MHGGERVQIATEQRIGGDDDVALGDGRGGALARGPMEEEHAQRRREARGLAHPVGRDRRRAHDERRGRPLDLLAPQQERQRRDRLSEPHVVRENSPGADRLQELEPGETEALVGPERSVEVARHVRLGGHGERAQPAPQGVDRGIDATVVLVDPPVESPELVRGEASFGAVHHLGGFLGERSDRRRDARQGPVAQRDPSLVAPERRTDDVELDRELARRELQPRVEPVPFEDDVNAPRQRRAHANARESLGQLDIDRRIDRRAQRKEPLLPERDRRLVRGRDARVVDHGVLVAAAHEPGRFHVGSCPRFVLEIAPLFRAHAVRREERHLARAVGGDELTADIERLACEAQDQARRLGGRQTEDLVRRQ